MNRILFAGGGTAGHVEPAWATSQAWLHRHPGDEVAFLGTKSGLEVTLIPDRGGRLFLIPKVVAPRKLNLEFITFPFRLINGALQSISIVRRFDVVVGFGGYVAASAYLAAALLRKPIVVHDQNAKPGLANRFGAIFTKDIAVAYPLAVKELRGAKIVGNPLRSQIIEAILRADGDWNSARKQAKEKLQISKELILVIGGSSGATSINKVIAEILETNSKIIEPYQVVHAVGPKQELPKLHENYRPLRYIEDMADYLLAADLVISRSGAIATTEIAALAKFALFIPLPIGNGEQELNAVQLVEASRAELITQENFTADWLALHLPRLMAETRKPEHLAPFGAPTNAADLIADLIESCLARAVA